MGLDSILFGKKIPWLGITSKTKFNGIASEMKKLQNLKRKTGELISTILGEISLRVIVWVFLKDILTWKSHRKDDTKLCYRRIADGKHLYIILLITIFFSIMFFKHWSKPHRKPSRATKDLENNLMFSPTHTI